MRTPPELAPRADDAGRRSYLGAGAGLLALCPTALLVACASTTPPPGVQPVSPFDLCRYEGLWYEIARLDNRFERGLSNVSARYTPQPDGSIEVLNRGFDTAAGRWREARGRATTTAGPNIGSLKVSFFGPFYGSYHVVALDTAYQWSLVIGADRSYCWILGRSQTLPPAVRDGIVQQARALRIATEALIWVSQTAPDAAP